MELHAASNVVQRAQTNTIDDMRCSALQSLT